MYTHTLHYVINNTDVCHVNIHHANVHTHFTLYINNTDVCYSYTNRFFFFTNNADVHTRSTYQAEVPWRSWWHPMALMMMTTWDSYKVATTHRMPYKLHVIFRKRAANYRALLRKTTCKDKASYGSSPPYRSRLNHLCIRIYDGVVSHVWKRHVPYVNTTSRGGALYLCVSVFESFVYTYVRRSRVTCMQEACPICQHYIPRRSTLSMRVCILHI